MAASMTASRSPGQPGREGGVGGLGGGAAVPERAQRELGVPDLDHAPVQAVAGGEPCPRLRRQPDVRGAVEQHRPKRAQAEPGCPHPAVAGCGRRCGEPRRDRRADDDLDDRNALRRVDNRASRSPGRPAARDDDDLCGPGQDQGKLGGSRDGHRPHAHADMAQRNAAGAPPCQRGDLPERRAVAGQQDEAGRLAGSSVPVAPCRAALSAASVSTPMTAPAAGIAKRVQRRPSSPVTDASIQRNAQTATRPSTAAAQVSTGWDGLACNSDGVAAVRISAAPDASMHRALTAAIGDRSRRSRSAVRNAETRARAAAAR